MATKTDADSRIDEGYEKGAGAYRNQTADDLDGAERASSGQNDSFQGQNEGFRGQNESFRGQNPSQSIDNKESNPMNFTGQGMKPGPGAVGGFSLKSSLRKKGPIGALVAALISIAAMFLFPSMAPFAMLYNVTNDLNDHLAALDIRQNHIFRNKVRAGQVADDTVAGCTKLTIRCKLKTISSGELKRLERAGFKVEGERKLFGRTVPTSYEFRGQTFRDGGVFLDALQNNPEMRNAHIRANNMSSIGYSSKTFMGRVMGRFGATKLPRTLTGSTQDRINQIMTAARTNDFGSIRFTPVLDDEDGEPVKPARWEATRPDGSKITNSDGSPRTYTDRQKASMERYVARTEGTSRPGARTPAGKIAIGAVSILAVEDLACTIKNMIGAAVVGAKIAVLADTIRHSMELSAQIGKIQAGDASPEDAEAVGEIIMAPDNRQLIENITKSVEAAAGQTPEDEIDAVLTANPNYGKNFLDSALMNMSINGGYAAGSASSARFSLGGGPHTLLRGLELGNNVFSTIINAGSKNDALCRFVQNPFVRAGGIVASVIAGFLSGGTVTAWQVGVTLGMIAAIIGLSYGLNAMLSGSVLDILEEEPEDKEANAAAVWTGLAGANSVAAQAYGGVPASAEEIAMYQPLRTQTTLAYAAAENYELNQFDISDPRTHLGSFVNNIHKLVGPSPSITTVASAIPRSLSSVISGNVYANTADIERFKQCDDEELDDLGIDPDVQCNVRYVWYPEDLERDPDDVAKWMEDNDYVEQDTETGLPAGYQPPDSAQSQAMLLQMLQGATVGQFFSNRNYGDGTNKKEYAYFLEHCAYRVEPYGNTYEESGLWGSAPREWLTGERCRDRNDMMSYFRAYTLDRATEEGLSEEVEQQYVNRATPGGPGGGGGGNLSDPNENCAPGTEEVDTVQTRYTGAHVTGGTPRPTIKLCRLSSIDGRGWNPATKDTDDFSGAVVNAAVSGVFQRLGEDMQSAGIVPYSSSSFRLVQPCSATGNGLCAPDGWSEHQIGAAIDFSMPTGDGFVPGATCTKNRSRSSEKIWLWLDDNANGYGVKHYAPEHWHWEYVPPGSVNDNKC